MKKLYTAAIFILMTLLGTSINVEAQTKELHLGFEDLSQERRGEGVQGYALNLEDVEDRSYLEVENPITATGSFTAHVWAKVNKNSKSTYTILSNVTPLDTLKHHWKLRITQFKNKQYRLFEGWKVGIQENGAWYFVIQNKNALYEYYPTIKQDIRDDQWHLISFSFNREKEEVALYLDGVQKAVLSIRNLKDISFSSRLVVGNSAEYFEDTTISKEWETFYGMIDEIRVLPEVWTAEKVEKHYKQTKDIIQPIKTKEQMPKQLKVVAFNIWDGGNHTGKEVGKKRLLELFKKENADFYTLVETYGSGAEIADELGFYYYLISSNLSVISRYPIEETFITSNSFLGGGARIMLPNGQRINVMSLWISHLPGFRDLFNEKGANVESFLAEEYKTRGKQLEKMLEEIKPLLSQTDQIPLIVGGDFNSGSHLDWSKKTAKVHNNYVVKFNASSMMEEQGFVDSYRQVHPDAILHRGFTWSPFYLDAVKERIDYIYYKGEKLKAIQSTMIDQHKAKFPSDHAGVSTIFQLNY